MEHVSTEEVDHVEHPAHVNAVRRPLSAALGTTDVALVYHELEPGDAFSGALHTHHDQEELFYVLEGTATFEVGRDRERTAVSAGELVRFAPGEFQHGFNATDDRVVALAVGAPGPEHDWDEEETVVECRACGRETVHDTHPVEEGSWQAETRDLRLRCRECGNSYTTAAITE